MARSIELKKRKAVGPTMLVHQFLIKYMRQIGLVSISTSNIWQLKLVTLLQEYCSKGEEEEEKKKQMYIMP